MTPETPAVAVIIGGEALPVDPGRKAFETYHERVACLSGLTAPTWEGVSDEERGHWAEAARAAVVAYVGSAGPGLEAEIELLPNSRHRSLAKTRAEEARLWLTAAPKFEVIP